MTDVDAVDLGPVAAPEPAGAGELTMSAARLALTFKDGEFGADLRRLQPRRRAARRRARWPADYVVCPWHGWNFHCLTGQGRARLRGRRCRRTRSRSATATSSSISRPPRHAARAACRRIRSPGAGARAGADPRRRHLHHGDEPGSPRASRPPTRCSRRPSTTPAAGAQHQLIRLNDLKFRACEGYYSKSADACTWPCSITQMDADRPAHPVYEALVFWADVVLVATPIRWGAASALYYKMVERMNCIQNQITIRDRVLIRNKVAGFIITGGQDNIQAVAGQMMVFFGELGFVFPQFPFIAHSRGWYGRGHGTQRRRGARLPELHEAARALAARRGRHVAHPHRAAIEDRKLRAAAARRSVPTRLWGADGRRGATAQLEATADPATVTGAQPAPRHGVTSSRWPVKYSPVVADSISLPSGGAVTLPSELRSRVWLRAARARWISVVARVAAAGEIAEGAYAVRYASSVEELDAILRLRFESSTSSCRGSRSRS